jgi:hypothetical protein
MTMTTEEITELELGLAQATGSEQYYKHWTRRLVYTDGVRFLADYAGAYWLIDLIASHQTKPKVKNAPIQMWLLQKNKYDEGARITCCHDIETTESEPNVGGYRDEIKMPLGVLAFQKIPYTDFPLPTITLYVKDGTLLLPSEY